MHTRFILLNTSHAGNVGAVARAMKVMGFNDLVLVQPRWPDVLQRPEAIERASGATDVLEQARIVQSWEEAVQGIEYLCATAMTARDFGPPTFVPRAHFAALAAQAAAAAPGVQNRPAAGANPSADQMAHQAPPPLRSMGLVFGCERYGMHNDQVYRCHACLRIPTHPAYGSLNLAAAVQLLAYEWRQALGGFDEPAATAAEHAPRRADAAQVQGMLAHWEQALVALEFLDPQTPRKLMPRLQQLFHRATLQEEEIHILRGIARAMMRAGKKSADKAD
ncbi:MAG: RNA methyltransferase [Brachymonas sp.]|nr:RNA methyltransferase [Brachymonas sp.]